MNARTNGTCVYSLSEVKFKLLSDKKGLINKRFLSGSLEYWLSIFVSSLSFELSQLFLYLWRFVLFYRHHTRQHKLKRVWDMILNLGGGGGYTWPLWNRNSEGLGGFNRKNHPWEGYGYFLESHIVFKNWNVFASLSKVLTKCTAKEGVDNAE